MTENMPHFEPPLKFGWASPLIGCLPNSLVAPALFCQEGLSDRTAEGSRGSIWNHIQPKNNIENVVAVNYKYYKPTSMLVNPKSLTNVPLNAGPGE